jgi:hypothetical protein
MSAVALSDTYNNDIVTFDSPAFQSLMGWDGVRALTAEELVLIAGGFNWRRLAAATIAGAAGGAAGGAVAGAAAGGVGALPGAGVGAAAGAVGGAVADTVMQLFGF